MRRRSRNHTQPDATHILTFTDVIPQCRVPVPGLLVLLIYVINLLDYSCTTADLREVYDDNVTVLQPVLVTTSQAVVGAHDAAQSRETAKAAYLKDSDKKHEKRVPPDDSKLNDVVHKLGLHVTKPQITQNVTSLAGLQVSPHVYTTEVPQVSTRRAIYIRGHLLRPPSSRKTKPFHPPEAADRGLFQAPNSIHLHRVQNFRDESDGEGSRKKRKQQEEKERFHNYKLLFGTIKGGEDPTRKRTEFYAWIFGAAMLAVVSLTTITSCFVFCFCGNRARKKRATKVRHPHDTAGEYQRVESVSSIVDHAGEPLDTIYEEQTEGITVI